MWTRRAGGADDDAGFSLAEILVVVVLLGLVSTLVTSAVIDSSKVTKVASAGLMSQSQLLDAVSRVTRDVSIATAIVNTRVNAGWPADSPSPSDLTVQSLREDSCLRTRYWVETAAGATEGVLKSETEEFVAQSCPNGTGDRTGVVTATVVTALSLAQPVFAYFDDANVALVPSSGGALPVGTVDGDVVARVGVDVGSAVEGRPNGIRLQTAAVPRSADPNAEPRDFAPPGQTSCEATSTSLTTGQVTWLAVTGARGYSVLRSDGIATNVAEGSSLIWAQTYLTPHEGYSFEVFPYNSSGFALAAAQCSFTAEILLRGKTIRDGVDGVDNDNELTWDPQDTAASYILYRDGVPPASLNTSDIVLDSDGRVRYVDVDRPWGATNVYVVTALNSVGSEGPRSNRVTLRIRPPAPEISGLDFVDNDKNPNNQNSAQLFCSNNYTNNNCTFNHLLWQAAAGWTPPPGTTYQVYREGVAIDSTTGLDSKSYAGECGVYHTYTVTVTIPYNGTSDHSSLAVVASFPCDPVLAGSAFDADDDGGDNDVRLSWDASPISPTFEVYRDSTLIGTTLSSSYVDRNRPPGSTTSYYVRAVNTAGRAASNTVSVLVAPAAPALVGFRAGDNSLTWEWTGVTGATSYQVYSRSDAMNSYTLRAVFAATKQNSSYTHFSRAEVAQRPYNGYAVACNSAGCSGPSETGRATPTSAYRTAVLADGPQAYWRLGDIAPADTTVTRDETANANILTYVLGGSPGIPTAFPLGLDEPFGALALDDNHALDLPDDNDATLGGFRRAITTADTPAANFAGLANITMEAWAYLDGSEHGMFMRAGDCLSQSTAAAADPCNGYGIGVGGDRTDDAPLGQTGWNANGAPFLNDGNRVMGLTERCGWHYGPTDVPAPLPGWHHIVMTVDSAYNGKLYQDGVLVASFRAQTSTCRSYLREATGAFHLGGYQYTYDTAGNVISRYFSGKIDEAAYYRRVLTETEVREHFFLGRYCSSTVGVTIPNCG